MKLIDKVQEVPSFKDIIGALDKNQVKKGIVGLNKSLKGQRVATRLDIPSYNKHDKWIVSIHEGLKGAPTAYSKTARLTDVMFGSSSRTALDIASEKLKPDKKLLEKAKEKFLKNYKRKPTSEEAAKMRSDPKNMRPQPKTTIARMEGDWVDTPDESTISFAENLFKRQKDGKFFDEAGEEWIQVGMNPYRGSYFYDKATGQALQAADEVIQVGPLVFAKNALSIDSSRVKSAIKSFEKRHGRKLNPNKKEDIEIINQIRIDAKKPTLSEYKKHFTFKDTQGKRKVFNKGGMVARNPYPEARGIY